jgi:hypothetical protein
MRGWVGCLIFSFFERAFKTRGLGFSFSFLSRSCFLGGIRISFYFSKGLPWGRGRFGCFYGRRGGGPSPSKVRYCKIIYKKNLVFFKDQTPLN